MLELKVIKGPVSSFASFPISSGKSFTIGRSEDCQIRLASTGISKKHCVLTVVSSSRVEVEDLGSSNGTYINGLLIKKHIMGPGDTLSVHSFVLQLKKSAPNVEQSQAEDILSNNFMDPSNTIDGDSVRGEEQFSDKIEQWLDVNVYPLADKLSRQVDIRLLNVIAIAIWTFIVTILSLLPFKDIANDRARDESVEVARLFARQIVRLNHRAVIEQRYKDLIADLDAQRGQTPGVIDALILDVVNGQILAPTERLGQPISKEMYYAQIALSKNAEHVSIDESNKRAYVSIPIKVGTSEGNKTVAAAYVEYSYVDGQFTFSNLVDQLVNSLLYALVLSGLFFIFVYRWTDGSLRRLAIATENALQKGSTSLDINIQWPALQKVSQEIGFCLTKAIEGNEDTTGISSGGNRGEWAIAAVKNTIKAAAAFDETLTVLAWNTSMAKIIGIQEQMALGADISQASRDIAFETAVRELSEDAQQQKWTSVSRSIDFSGRSYKISMVFGAKSFLVNIDAEET